MGVQFGESLLVHCIVALCSTQRSEVRSSLTTKLEGIQCFAQERSVVSVSVRSTLFFPVKQYYPRLCLGVPAVAA